MEMKRSAQVQQAICDFKRDFIDSFPELIIRNAYDSNWSKEDWNQNKLKGFSSSLRGVYLAYTDEGTLQYVGVASTNFSKRVWSHNDWLEYRYIDIIPFEPRYFHFALALEYYLIAKLKPKQNNAFLGHELPDSPA